MEILKFTLSGAKANFTRPYFNTYFSTYSHIHKVALLGMLGAVIGIRRKTKSNGILLAYEELESLKIAIVPHKVTFPEVKNTITETTGMYNKGFTYVANYIELCNPAWDIYIYGNENPNYETIKEYILENKSIYNIYLGRNHHFASISNQEILEGFSVEEVDRIDSLFISEGIETEEEEEPEDDDFDRFYLSEPMPVGMDKILNQYISKEIVYTNDEVTSCNDYNNIIRCTNKNLFLI